ncbi:VOC family protein [Amphibacillus jilinensis]|uniref:VOC family protein n=1 Tax=Amphibacillus jilinensis TaxID=1216008 RepID=UPI0002F66729|nr:VOC family protein [Amphibacillus jilinensis]
MNRINLICLGVANIPRALDFYQKIGFETTAGDNAPVVFFKNSGTKLELFNIHELAKDIDKTNPPQVNTGGFAGITLAINMKSKQEVDAFFALVAQHGATIVKPPETVSWGGYSGYFTDLDGYYWEVAYGEDWIFDDNDMLIIE